MNKIQSLILILLGLFIMIHTIFPPRISELSAHNKHTRAYIFSDTFEKVDINKLPLSDMERDKGISDIETSNTARLDWTRYIVILIVGIGFFISLFGVLTIRSKSSEGHTI